MIWWLWILIACFGINLILTLVYLIMIMKFGSFKHDWFVVFIILFFGVPGLLYAIVCWIIENIINKKEALR